MPKSRGSFDLGGIYLPMINKDRPITGMKFESGLSGSWGEKFLWLCSV